MLLTDLKYKTDIRVKIKIRGFIPIKHMSNACGDLWD